MLELLKLLCIQSAFSAKDLDDVAFISAEFGDREARMRL
jgi:hypothetical protein